MEAKQGESVSVALINTPIISLDYDEEE